MFFILVLTHHFGKPEYLHKLGNPLQTGLYMRYLRFAEKKPALLGPLHSQQRSFDSSPGQMTDLVLQNYVTHSTQKSVATVSEMFSKSEKNCEGLLGKDSNSHGVWQWLVDRRGNVGVGFAVLVASLSAGDFNTQNALR